MDQTSGDVRFWLLLEPARRRGGGLRADDREENRPARLIEPSSLLALIGDSEKQKRAHCTPDQLARKVGSRKSFGAAGPVCTPAYARRRTNGEALKRRARCSFHISELM
jgi:hypothetical protein